MGDGDHNNGAQTFPEIVVQEGCHPIFLALLGKLTVREMLFFTFYHYEHHRAIVAQRLGGSGRSTLSISGAARRCLSRDWIRWNTTARLSNRNLGPLEN